MESQGNKSTHVISMGKEKAFDYFFRQYYTSLCFFANSILHNQEESKDIVQDCFVKLWDSENINERFETVKSFLYTSIRNACIDFIRKKQVREKARLQILRNNNEENFEYFDEIAFAEMMSQIVNYIEELPVNTQKIFRLYYFEDKKHSEIANEINSTPEVVQKQKERAIKKIRKNFILSFFYVIIVTQISF